jgi:acetyl-CoA carboxylase carboxyltransferase component
MYEEGRATETAANLEIDAVIDPADTRKVISIALTSAPKTKFSHRKRRNFVDVW